VYTKTPAEINMIETEQSVSFYVRNKVREDVKLRGVVAGTTDKGLGRGNGLSIAEKIIKKYSNVVHNSYFLGDDFVQQLVVFKM